MAWIDRTAYPRLSGSPSARELAEVFTPSADELAWVQARTISEHHRLALLVLLLCLWRSQLPLRCAAAGLDAQTSHHRGIPRSGSEPRGIPPYTASIALHLSAQSTKKHWKSQTFFIL